MVSVVRNKANIPTQVTDRNIWLDSLPQHYSAADISMLQAALGLLETHYPTAAATPMGENMRAHLMTAALIVADLNILADAVAATLLCRLPEYCPTHWQEYVQAACPPHVIPLIEGLDQIQKLTEFARVDKMGLPEERQRQAETMRKMLLAMVSDIRVVLIKLALRTQTMHFIGEVPDSEARRALAKETLDIFAPLANRLGVWQLKWELEDLGFRYQEPEAYSRIAKLLDEKRIERLDYIDNVVHTLKSELDQLNIHADVAGRPKHIYSIYKKMTKKKVDFSGLYDIRAVRILVDSIPECYTALGIVHSMWQPIPGEFDDYIAHPKANNYRSLHTVVVGPEDKGVEVQIRTFAMHEFAEFGVAAHWRYKEGGSGDSEYEQKIAWLRQLLDWRENMAETDKADLADAFQTELFKDTIYVLTPHGKVLSLPSGATPIDFAYALHSSIGDRCRGAKVDGQIVPLSTALENGQRVEIITAKEGNPSVNWLHEGWVKSNKAISKIRAFIRQQNTESVRENGKNLFDKQVAKSQHKPNLQQLCEALGYAKLDDLYIAIGHGEVSQRSLNKALGDFTPAAQEPVTADSMIKQSKVKGRQSGILVDGETGLLTVLAKCCKPAPPDEIIGFVTKGRGISVHRKSCAAWQNLAQQHPDKVLAASWAQQTDAIFPIDIEIRARDRSGLLRDVSDALSRNKLNVTAVQTLSKDLIASMRFTVEVRQVEDLPRVLASLNEVKGVLSVQRL